MKIILVEDEGITTLFLKETLESLGHECIGLFNNATELFEFLKNDPSIDLIFMDICIQGALDGIEAAQIIRKKYNHIAVVFLTSYKDSETIASASVAKPLGYLIKPVCQSSLEAVLMVIKSNKQCEIFTSCEIIFSDVYVFHKEKKCLRQFAK